MSEGLPENIKPSRVEENRPHKPNGGRENASETQDSHRGDRGRYRKPSSKKSREKAKAETRIIGLTGHALSPEGVAFVKSIPTDRDFDREDVPPFTREALHEAGLRILSLDRDGGKSHITLTDGVNTERILHSEVVVWLQNLVEAYEEDARNLASIEEEIRVLEAQLAESKPIPERGDEGAPTSPPEEGFQAQENPPQASGEGILSDEEYLKQLRENGGKNNTERPDDSTVLPVLDDVVSLPPNSAEQIFNELIARVKTTKKPPAGWSDTVPTLPLSDEVIMSDDIKIRSLPVLTDVIESPTVDILLPDAEQVSSREIRPIVLKALGKYYKHVRVLPNGQIELARSEGGKAFTVNGEEANRLIKLNAERSQIDAVSQNEKESEVAEQTTSNPLAVIEEDVAAQGEENSPDVLRIEHAQEIFDPIVGETADRLQRKSAVLRALSEDVEDAKIIERSEQPVQPVVLKALSMLFKKAEVSLDGQQITLQREGGVPFEISVKDAPRMVSLEAESMRLKKETEATSDNLDDIVTAPSPLEPVEPKGPSLDDPMIQQSLHRAVIRNRSQLGKFDKEIANRVRREGEENKIAVPAIQPEKGSRPKLTREEMQAYLTRVKNKTEHRGEPTEDAVAPEADALSLLDFEDWNEYLAATGGATKPKKPHLNNAESIAYLKDVQEKRKIQRESLEQFQPEIGSPIPEPGVGVTPEGLDKLDIDLSETSEEGVDILLPLEPFGKENPPVLTDVVSSSTVDIELPPELEKNAVTTEPPIEGQRGEKLGLLDYLVRTKEIRDQKRRDAGLNAPNFFDERFEKNFGISYEEIGEIDGFTKLSSGQQVLVYENLKEYVEQGDKGYLGAVWSGIKGVVGNKKEAVIPKGTRGIDAYRDVLDTLIYAASTGPKVHMENGVPMPDFVGMGYDREHRKEQKAACDVLNRAAHVFARVPIAWQEGRSKSKTITFLKEKIFRVESQKRLRTYEARQQAFEEAKRIFTQQLEATGVPREQIVRKLIEVDGQIHMLRFIETNPEAVALLRNIKDDDLWKGVGKTLASRSLNSEFGSVSRAATAEALKFLSGPLVAASLAGAGRWSLSAAEQRERDRRTQTGNGLTSTGTRSSISAREEMRTPEGLKDMGVTAKLSRLTEQFRTFPPEEKCTKEQKTNRNRLLNQLKTLVTFSYDKLKLKRIQFGSKADAAVNATKFFETLARAQIILAEEELSARAPVSESDSRFRRYSRKFTIAVSLAGAATLAGVFAVDEFKTGETTGKLKDWFTSVKSDSPSFETTRITVVPSSEKSLNQNQLDAQVGHANAEPLEKLEPFPVEEKFSSVKEMAELKEIPTVQSAPIGAGTSALTGEGIPQAEPPVTEVLSTRKSPTAAEKAEIQKLFTEKPSVAYGPRQLSPEAFAELKGLFTEKISALPKPEAFDMVSGEILKRTFLEKTVGGSWSQVSNISIESFMLKTMEEGTGKASGLTQLGKIFREVGKPPYNVTMHRSDSTEIFAKQAFTAIELARKAKLETDTMRELLESTRRIGKK